MKYITIDEYYSDDDANINKKLNEYSKYFDTIIRNHLSKSFVSKYLKCCGFHDWDVVSIENNAYTYDHPKRDLIVTLHKKSGNITKKIHYNKVRVFKINLNKSHFEQWSYDEYVIDEFLLLDNSYLSHEVYFPSGSSYYVEFKTIKII